MKVVKLNWALTSLIKKILFFDSNLFNKLAQIKMLVRMQINSNLNYWNLKDLI